MIEQLELAPVEREREATDRAIQQAADNSEPGWLDEARTTITRLAHTRQTFISDDVWSAGLSEPHEARALGNVLRWAARTGLIVGTDQFRPSQRSGCHQCPRRVWRSLVYEGGS